MTLPDRTPDYVGILLTAVAYNLRVRDPQDPNFEVDFRRAFAEAAHTIGVFHRAEPQKYNYFFGKVRERIEGMLAPPRKTRVPGPIATRGQLKLPFTGPPPRTAEASAPPPRYLMK